MTLISFFQYINEALLTFRLFSICLATPLSPLVLLFSAGGEEALTPNFSITANAFSATTKKINPDKINSPVAVVVCPPTKQIPPL